MRRGPSKLVTAVAVVSVAMPLAAGARPGCTEPLRSPSSLTVVAPQGSMAPLPEAPPDEPAPASPDWTTASGRRSPMRAGADISVVVLDRSTGQIGSGGNG